MSLLNTMPRLKTLLVLAGAIAGCASAPMKSGALIDQFSRAACVPARRAEPNALREWDYLVQPRCNARIVGAQASTGLVSVEFPPDNARRVVADFGEKSNPVEVRVDPVACRLYVKANGSPLFTNNPPMWLLEYDLLRREEVQHAIVEPKALPTTCAETLDAG